MVMLLTPIQVNSTSRMKEDELEFVKHMKCTQPADDVGAGWGCVRLRCITSDKVE